MLPAGDAPSSAGAPRRHRGAAEVGARGGEGLDPILILLTNRHWVLANTLAEKPKLLHKLLCFQWRGHWDGQLLHCVQGSPGDAHPAEPQLGFQTRPGALGVPETLPVPLSERSIVIPRK